MSFDLDQLRKILPSDAFRIVEACLTCDVPSGWKLELEIWEAYGDPCPFMRVKSTDFRWASPLAQPSGNGWFLVNERFATAQELVDHCVSLGGQA